MSTGRKHPLPMESQVLNDSSAEQLVLFLNEHPAWKCTNELGKLILYLNGVERIAAVSAKLPRPERMGSLQRALTPEGFDESWESVLDDVNARLDSARFKFRLLKTPEGWKREWKPVRAFGLGQDAYLLNLGLTLIGDLAERQELAKLRHCAYCRNWYVTSRNRRDARFCNEGCQQSWHRKTEQGRRKQREYTASSRARKKRMLEAQKRVTRALAQSRRPGQA